MTPDSLLKISCRKCDQHLDVTLLSPFHSFRCPSCGELCIVPKRFDQYLLERKIAVGGMAEVYFAREEKTGKELAVKIKTPPPDEMGLWKRRFQEELEMIADIRHPNILKIFRCGQVQNQIFVAMEYLPQGDLEKQQEDTLLLSIARRCLWIAQTASGLAALFQAGLIHHDIKPGNLLLSADGIIKICDFDLLEDRRTSAAATAQPIYGSPDYVSPERLDSGCEDEKGDIFSLGATAYELLTGRCPFPRGKNEEEMLQIRKETLPLPPRQLQEKLPQPVSSTILKMLSFSPQERPDYPEIIRIFSNTTEPIFKRRVSIC